MNKAIKYRVYPTTEQRILFAKTFGCCRKVYNLMLSDKIEGYKATGKFPTVTPAEYKKDYPYLKEVDSLALANKQMDLQAADYLGIGTLESYLKMREYYGEEALCPIYIEVEDGERLERALKREREQEKPRYEDMCRRFLADQKDFSEKKIAAAGIQRRFQNNSIEECVNEIADYIKMF